MALLKEIWSSCKTSCRSRWRAAFRSLFISGMSRYKIWIYLRLPLDCYSTLSLSVASHILTGNAKHDRVEDGSSTD